MSSSPVIANEARQSMPAQLLTWLPIIIGLAVLYVPSLYDLFTGIWRSDEPMPRHIVLDISALLLIIGLDTTVQKFGPFRQNQA